MKLICFSLFFLLIVSCNSIQTDAPRILNDTLVSQFNIASRGLLGFVDFKKTDGVEYQEGSLRYKLTFKGFVGATKDCYWDGDISSGPTRSMGIGSMRIAETMEELEARQWYNKSLSTYYRYSLYQKDYGHYVTGYAIFEKRDSGWKMIAYYCGVDASE